MSKKNPIINIPKGLIKEDEKLSILNEEVINTKEMNGAPKDKLYVTDSGRIFKVNENNILEEKCQTYDAHGYTSITYRDIDNNRCALKVHRAVLGTFNPLSKEEMDNLVVNHVNGKQKSNNRIDNLEWLTQGDNVRDAIAQGLKETISDFDIVKILHLARAGYDDAYIGRIVNRSPNTITQIRTGNGDYKKRIENLGEVPAKEKHYLSEEDYKLIYLLIDQGYNDAKIANIIGGSAKTVADIRTGNGERYKAKLEQYGRESVRKLAKITDDVILYIYKAAEEGKSDEEIAYAIGSGPGTVGAIRSGQSQYIDRIRALGLTPIKNGGGVITDDDIRTIIKLAKEGKRDQEISEITNIPIGSVETVRQGGNTYARRLYNLGLQPVLFRKRLPLSDDDYRELIRLAKEGVSDEELAVKFDRTPKGIQAIRIGQDKNADILKRLGLEPVRTCIRARNK